MYYNVTEKVRRVMESYFRLDTPLYFSYSHLVCRTAIEGRPRHPCSFSRVGRALSLHGTLWMDVVKKRAWSLHAG